MWSGEVRSLGFFAVAAVLPLLSVNGLYCPLPETAERAEDHVSICAMCSDSAAAVRWRVRRDVSLVMLLRYECEVNGTVVYQGSSRIRDPCFDPYPDVDESFTGTTGVGYELWTGVQCEFRVGYRTNESIVETTTCTVKSSETCAESPDECSIDRVSSLNGEGECEFQCTTGYSGQLCNNINECSGSNVCDGNADCHDTDGSYWCECRPGFQGDGYNCTNTDECAGNDAVCDGNADCHDTDGSYWCECRPGFQGDGYNCTEMRCGDNAERVSFSCQCKPGFTGDGYNCTDIDECLNVPCSGENSECVNTEGNYSCQCEPGFTGDGHNCTDIKECSNDHHTCPDGSYCINLNGSYHCKPNVVSSKMSAVTMAVIILCIVAIIVLILVIVVLMALLCRPWVLQFMPANKSKVLRNQEHTKEIKDHSWSNVSVGHLTTTTNSQE